MSIRCNFTAIRILGSSALAVAAFSLSGARADTYTQDFSGFADGTVDLGDGSFLIGNAAGTPQVIGGQLRLTENTNNNNAAFHIPALSDSSQGFTVTFDLTMSDSAEAGAPADGIAFSYGAIPYGTNSTLPEEGWPGVENVLSYEIDTYNEGSDWGPAIGLNRPAGIADVGLSAHTSSLGFTFGQVLADAETRTVPVTISWDRGLGASFSTSGFITDANFVNVTTKGFPGDDNFTFAIAGRTGGANEEVLIDNLVITTGVLDTDGDGMSDAYENARGLDPNDDGSSDPIEEGADGDLDGDGLTNIEEHDLGTLPNNVNTDGDNLNDGEEVLAGRDPLTPDDPPLITEYMQDFDAFADGTTDLGDGTTVASTGGLASVSSGELLITQDDVNDQRASFRIPALGNTSSGWVAAFDYTLSDAPGGNPPADGFSFNWGAIPAYDPVAPVGGATGHGSAEEGWAQVEHISFEVDVWQPLNPSQDAGVNIASVTGTSPAANHAYTPGDVAFDGETRSGKVVVAWHPTDGATFYTTGFNTNADFTDVLVPGLVGSDQYSFGFSARTGGANEGLSIDNVAIFASDGDLDGDGLGDAWELLHGLSIDPVTGANGDDGATGNPDGDTIDNAAEFAALTNPNAADSDGDTLEDGAELAGAGVRPPTDPTLADTDGDTIDDLAESNSGSFVDGNDTGTDPTNPDTDSDLFPDGRELLRGNDPLGSGDSPASVVNGVYTMDFEAYPVGYPEIGDGSVFGSTTGVHSIIVDRLDPSNRALRLTDKSTGSTSASFRIPAIPGSEEGWTATFDVGLVDAVGGNVPADGFSFSYGAIPPLTANDASASGHGAAEAGMGSGNEVSAVVDTYQNGVGGNGVRVLQNGAVLDEVVGQVLPNDGSLIANVTVVYTPTSLSFSTVGLNDTNASFVEIPHTLVADGSFSWAFSARTGGATEDFFIDNLEIVISGGGAPPLAITDVTYNPVNGEITVTWDSLEGRIYAVDGSTDLQEDPVIMSAWVELTDGVTATGPSTSYTHTVDPLTTERYYIRVRDISQ